MNDTNPTTSTTAVFGGGCFWCLEAAYQRLAGVVKVRSGYAGGTEANPTYEQVCAQATGHAEVVAVTFNVAKISYTDLLEMFWKVHDPTTKDRQGGDKGSQYRSVILTADDEQASIAQASLKAAQQRFAATIVTEVKPLEHFWPAELDHHDYYNRNQTASYCKLVIAPKLAKLALGYRE